MPKRKRQQVEEHLINNNNNETSKKSKVSHSEEQQEQQYEIESEFDITLEAEKKEEFVLTREIAEHTILRDITGNKWRIGAPIGRGAFGEIFLASNDIAHVVSSRNAQYVTKIEPHSNGPLFVEIHCLMNVNRKSEEELQELDTSLQSENVGIPRYIASGSHFFNESRYRFLIMPRFKTDLHSIMKHGRLSHKHFLIVASQIIDVIMHLHSRNYVHSDIKAENIMLGSCGTDLSMSPGSRARRMTKAVKYAFDEYSRSSRTPESGDESAGDDDEDFQVSPRKGKAKKAAKKSKKATKPKGHVKNLFKSSKDESTEPSDDRVHIIDYGLATKFVNSTGEHKPFCCDERRAHDGTLEFTSRDAHFGAHSRRSDLECLGYNLIYWSQGFLPWKDEKLKEQPEIVHRMKSVFMTDVKEILKLLYGRDVPKYLGEFMSYVNGLEFDQEPNYAYLKGLFEKEFVKLGFKNTAMKLNIGEMKSECVMSEQTETDLMMSTIADLKTVRKLGFLIATDAVDGIDLQLKTTDTMNMTSSCKISPKNLRSKEKTDKAVKGKRQKRQPKMTEKEVVIEKMAQGEQNLHVVLYLFLKRFHPISPTGKKLSIAEISLLDPEQIVQDRADREYEKFEEKNQSMMSVRYSGNPTYAIIEIETKLRNRASGIYQPNSSSINMDFEYNSKKSTCDSNAKKSTVSAVAAAKPIVTTPVKNREAMKNVIKSPSKKTPSPRRRGRKGRRGAPKRAQVVVESVAEPEPEAEPVGTVEDEVVMPPPPKRKRGRPPRQTSAARVAVKSPTPSPPPRPVTPPQLEDEESNDDESEVAVEPPKKKRKQQRGKPKAIVKTIIEAPDTEEEASVYYDIPGEGSNDSIKDISEDENHPKIFISKKGRRNVIHDEDSNTGSVASSGDSVLASYKVRDRYYKDEDFDASQEEDVESVVSEVSEVTKSSVSTFKPKTKRTARKPTKSRSTSRSAALDEYEEEETDEEPSEQSSEVAESEFIQDSDDEDEDSVIDDDEEPEDVSGDESEMADYSNESNDSIDIKYSPIKTRNARRTFAPKQIRGFLSKQSFEI